MKMERGGAYFDTIYTGAPVLGMIGTCVRLLGALPAHRDQITGLPDPAKFSQSVGYRIPRRCCGPATSRTWRLPATV
jgi:biopolymer transport protein ExbB